MVEKRDEVLGRYEELLVSLLEMTLKTPEQPTHPLSQDGVISVSSSVAAIAA